MWSFVPTHWWLAIQICRHHKILDMKIQMQNSILQRSPLVNRNIRSGAYCYFLRVGINYLPSVIKEPQSVAGHHAHGTSNHITRISKWHRWEHRQSGTTLIKAGRCANYRCRSSSRMRFKFEFEPPAYVAQIFTYGEVTAFQKMPHREIRSCSVTR